MRQPSRNELNTSARPDTSFVFVLKIRRPVVAILTIASIVSFSTPAAALTFLTEWTSGDGSWFDTQQWTNGVPDSSTFLTYIESGNVTIESGGTAEADSLEVAKKGSVSLTIAPGGTLISSDTLMGSSAGLTGMVTVNGLWTGRTVDIGAYGTGILTINNTGTISSKDNFVAAGKGVTGTAIVSGSWVNTRLDVGYLGTGNLTINSTGYISSASSTVGDKAGSSGTATVDGTWNGSAFFTVGEEASASGYLSINKTGFVSDQYGTIASAPGSTGTAIVSGTWNHNIVLTVGNGGNGFLTVTTPGTVSSQETYIGLLAGAAGTATVSGVLSNSDRLFLGYSGTGTLTITSDGAVSDQSVYIGVDTTSTGTAIVSGTWQNSGAITVGDSGTGSLIISSGGDVRAGSGVFLAIQAGSKGTLQIGDGATAGTLNASIISGGNGTADLIFDHTDAAYLLSSNLEGGLNVTQSGPGTTILTGSNSYTGITAVTSGTLQIGYGGTTGSLGSNAVVNNGKLVFNRSDTLSVTNAISGSGVIEQQGSGTTILAGTSSYSGATIVTQGTLEIANGASVSDGVGNATGSSGTIIVNGTWNNSHDLYLGINIGVLGYNVGSGNLIVNSGGFVSDQVGYVGEGVGSTGTITVSGTWSNSSLAFLGDSGRGSVTLNPGGTILAPDGILLTTNDISQGILRIQGGTLATPIVIGAGGDAEVIFDHTINGYVFDPHLSGNLKVIQDGPGTTILTGTSVYSGPTLVKNGKLLVNGYLSETNATVGTDGILGGSGFIGGNVNVFGILSPGNSPGTLHIGKNLTMHDGSLFVVQLASPLVYDRVIAGGAAHLDGSLQVLTLGGFVPKAGQQFNILTAQQINGKFDNFAQPASLKLSIIYTPSSVLLEILPDPRTPYTEFAQSKNQRTAAKALEAARARELGTSSDFDVNIRPRLDLLPVDELRDAFDSIGPGQTFALTQVALDRSRVWLPQMATRMADIRAGLTGFGSNSQQLANAEAANGTTAPSPRDRWGAWVDGAGVSSDNVDDDTSGTVGADYRLGKDFTLGLYSGYVGSFSHFGVGNDISGNGSRFGVYSTYQNGGFYINGVIGGEWNRYDWNRRIGFLGVDRSATAETDGTVFETMLGGGYDWKLGTKLTVGLFDSLEYTSVSVDGFTESGARSLDLKVNGQNAASLRTDLGAQIAYSVPIHSFILHPSARVAWRHEYLDATAPRSVDSALEGGDGPTFTTNLPGTRRSNSVLLNAGFSLDLTKSVSVYTYYTGDVSGGRGDVHAVNGGIRCEF